MFLLELGKFVSLFLLGAKLCVSLLLHQYLISVLFDRSDAKSASCLATLDLGAVNHDLLRPVKLGDLVFDVATDISRLNVDVERACVHEPRHLQVEDDLGLAGRLFEFPIVAALVQHANLALLVVNTGFGSLKQV